MRGSHSAPVVHGHFESLNKQLPPTPSGPLPPLLSVYQKRPRPLIGEGNLSWSSSRRLAKEVKSWFTVCLRSSSSTNSFSSSNSGNSHQRRQIYKRYRLQPVEAEPLLVLPNTTVLDEKEDEERRKVRWMSEDTAVDEDVEEREDDGKVSVKTLDETAGKEKEILVVEAYLQGGNGKEDEFGGGGDGEDSKQSRKRKRTAWVPKYAKMAFLRTATSRVMMRRNSTSTRL